MLHAIDGGIMHPRIVVLCKGNNLYIVTIRVLVEVGVNPTS